MDLPTFLLIFRYRNKAIKVMRYSVKVFKGEEIKTIYSSNDHSSAMAIYIAGIKIYGKDNIWMSDSVQEILVG